MNVVTYRTEHFEFRAPIDDWNKNKIPLPEGAGAKFIAPSDLTAILLKKFYYDWNYETDGVIKYSPVLVYGERWVGKEIHHFPFCKELLDFLEWLKKEYGWYIFTSWEPFYKAVRRFITIKQGTVLPQVANKYVAIAFQKEYNLGLSGCVYKGSLVDLGINCSFWSASGDSAGNAHCLRFDSAGVNPRYWGGRYSARSVRCVSE